MRSQICEILQRNVKEIDRSYLECLLCKTCWRIHGKRRGCSGQNLIADNVQIRHGDTSIECANRIWIQTINAFKAIPKGYMTWVVFLEDDLHLHRIYFCWHSLLWFLSNISQRVGKNFQLDGLNHWQSSMKPCKWPHWNYFQAFFWLPSFNLCIYSFSNNHGDGVEIRHVGGWRQVISLSGIRCLQVVPHCERCDAI